MLFLNYNEESVNFYLNSIKKIKFKKKIEKIIFDYIDNPYKNNPLLMENNNIPSFDLYNVDCSTFVINAYALYLSADYKEYIKNYTSLMYKNSVAVFEKRIHFTADRLKNSDMFEIVYLENLPFENINCRLNYNDGQRLIEYDFDCDISIPYVSIKNEGNIKNFLLKNNNVLGIAFLKIKNIAKGHIFSHEGFICGNKLVHASRNKMKVCEENNLIDYMTTSQFDGFTLFDLKKY